MIKAMPDQKEQPAAPTQATSSPAQKNSNSKLIIIIVVVAAVLAVLGGGAYYASQYFAEKSAEKVVEKATGGKVDVGEGGDKVTYETDEGKVTIGQNEIPDSFPSDITVYSGAKVTTTSDTDEGVMVVLETSDSVSKVFNFYKQDLTSNSWKQTISSTEEDSAVLQATKGEKQVIILLGPSSEDSSVTQVIITVGNVSS
jgi:hypothetical protein